MDCNTARMLATFFGRRGSELAPEDAAALDAHLAGCPGCAAAVQSERAFDDRIAQAMMAVPVPTGLKAKILDGVTAQKAAWYRQKAWGLAGLATAACLLIGGVIGYRILTAPDLIATQLISEQGDQIQAPDGYIDDFLDRRGYRFNPERRFDMRLFDDVAMGELRKREVPVLYFKNLQKNAFARVYIVKDSVLNWKTLPRDGSSIPGGFGLQLAVVLDTVRGDVAYVVVYTGESLELFLESPSRMSRSRHAGAERRRCALTTPQAGSLSRPASYRTSAMKLTSGVPGWLDAGSPTCCGAAHRP